MKLNILRHQASLVAQMVQNLSASAGDLPLIPGSGRSSGEGNGYPRQYSCLENFMDRRFWQAIVHAVTKESDTYFSSDLCNCFTYANFLFLFFIFLVCFYFSSCFKCKVRLSTRCFSCFLRQDCIAINLPLRISLAESYRF